MMEYAKDEVFQISYNQKKDKLEYPLRKRIRESIRHNRILTLFLTLGISFSVINFILIYNFFALLEKI